MALFTVEQLDIIRRLHTMGIGADAVVEVSGNLRTNAGTEFDGNDYPAKKHWGLITYLRATKRHSHGDAQTCNN